MGVTFDLQSTSRSTILAEQYRGSTREIFNVRHIMPHNSKILTYIALKLYTYSKGLTRLAKRRNALGCFSLHWTEILYCMKTRSLPAQTANCPLLPNHGLHWLHWDDPNLRSTVFMKTVFMLNALFFLQHKRYSVLIFFSWCFSLT